MRKLQLLFIIAVLMLGAASTVQADVPLDSGGDPVTAEVSVIFSIWDSDPDGDSVWSEQRSVTPDADGSFNILLGQVTPLADTVFSDPERYLGIAVAGDPEMTPRVRLAACAYAQRVATIDEALRLSDTLLSIPSEITVPMLRSDPDFAPLRDRPRIQELLEKYDTTPGAKNG